MADRTPDYDADDLLEVREPERLRALAHPTRRRLVALLSERAATTSELAETLGAPKGTVGYHLKVLERTGLVRVVRTEQVRAITAKYYGRTARTFVIRGPSDDDLDHHFMLHEAMAGWVPDEEGMTTLRFARIPRERARAWAERLAALAEEFVAQEPDGDEIHGLLLGIHRTDRTALPEPPVEGADG
jgi:DNA-binding transcriptional ArsR family regulator